MNINIFIFLSERHDTVGNKQSTLWEKWTGWLMDWGHGLSKVALSTWRAWSSDEEGDFNPPKNGVTSVGNKSISFWRIVL